MKKFILALIILFSNQFLFAQNSIEKLSITFKDDTLATALKAIESSTSYKIYFDPTWVDSNKKQKRHNQTISRPKKTNQCVLFYEYRNSKI